MSVTKHYRVNGTDTYSFEFTRRWWSGKVDIKCTRRPHNPRSKCVTDCHVYADGTVCVARGKEPRTLDKAIAIAQHFAQGYSQFIRTGTFPNGARRVST